MTPDFLGAFTCWLLKRCRTNFFKHEYVLEKEKRNRIVGYIIALLLVGLGMFLLRHKILPLGF